MELIRNSWNKELILGVDALLFKNGTVYLTEIEVETDVLAIRTFGKRYSLAFHGKRKIGELLNENSDVWSEIQVYGEVPLLEDSKLIYGEGEMGNEGFIACINPDNQMEWSFFSTKSNPFIESNQENGKIQIFSSHGFSVVVYDVKNTLGMNIDNQLI